MSKEILQDIIDSFAPDKFSRFFRDKNRLFSPRQEDVRHYDDENFKGGLKLGEIQFSKTEKLIVCAFQVKQSLSERSGKKAQYEKGKKILKDTQSDAGIVIFYDQNGNFRFSLIYPETIGNRRQWSSFRRFTYFVSREFTNKTFLQRIGDNEFSSIEKIKDAFSVEKVTKEFYLEYRKLFESLVKDLSSNHTFTNEASKNDINTENFAKKLLGQIVFIYFIQKKGWMGVPAGQNWGAGDKNFLINQFKEAIAKKSNFFNDYLESLFYGTLNNPRRNSADPSFSKEFNSRIPFLNGGLFEAEYDWKNSFIYLDNNIFKNIFDVFERFNFTVEEESPDDKEIAVDPEMLGKVFENLLPENLRKGTGTYYTPREIVYYMCQESLVNYLDSNSKLGKEKIEKFVKSLREGDNLISDKEAVELDSFLEAIKICDPACGSGAFLVGMLNEIVRLRLLLRVLYPSKLSKKSEYQLKKDTIHNCVYGVDIDPGAIEIAKLRLWLTLVVDYEIKEIEPLPNLDYRLMCGNSLLEEFEGVRFYNGNDEKKDLGLFKDTKKQEKIAELKKRVEEYFDIHDDVEKRSKRKEINDIKDWLIKTALERRRKELASYRKTEESKLNMFNEESRKKYFENWGTKFLAEGKINEVLRNLHDPRKAKPFFIWQLEFIDVFEDKGGFDVIIANPPYISFYSRQSRLDEYKDEVEILRKTYQFTNKSIPGRLNSVMFFIEKAINLLRIHGGMSFIIDANFHESSFRYIRKYIAERTRICYFIDKFSTFECVNSDQVILALSKPLITRDLTKDEFIYFQEFNDIQNKKSLMFPQKGVLEDAEFNFAVKKYDVSVNDAKPLSAFYDTVTGVQIGIGGTRRYKGVDIEQLFYADSRKNKNYYPIISLKSSDFYRYCKVKFNRFLNFDINLGYEINKAVSKCNIAIPKYEQYLRVPKVIVRQSSASITATYTEEYAVAEYSAFSIKEKMHGCSLKYLLSVLNSSFVTYYCLKNKIIKTGIKKQPQIRIKGIDSIPIRQISMAEQKPFIGLVDKILSATEDDDYLQNSSKQAKVKEYACEIDQMVYKLYGLTKEEIQIIESAGER